MKNKNHYIILVCFFLSLSEISAAQPAFETVDLGNGEIGIIVPVGDPRDDSASDASVEYASGFASVINIGPGGTIYSGSGPSGEGMGSPSAGAYPGFNDAPSSAMEVFIPYDGKASAMRNQYTKMAEQNEAINAQLNDISSQMDALSTQIRTVERLAQYSQNLKLRAVQNYRKLSLSDFTRDQQILKSNSLLPKKYSNVTEIDTQILADSTPQNSNYYEYMSLPKKIEKLFYADNLSGADFKKAARVLSKCTRDGVLIPYLFDKALQEDPDNQSPLSHLKFHASSNHPTGAAVRRAANNWQAKWGAQEGFRQFSREDQISYLVGVSILKSADAIMAANPESAKGLAMAYLSQAILELSNGEAHQAGLTLALAKEIEPKLTSVIDAYSREVVNQNRTGDIGLVEMLVREKFQDPAALKRYLTEFVIEGANSASGLSGYIDDLFSFVSEEGKIEQFFDILAFDAHNRISETVAGKYTKDLAVIMSHSDTLRIRVQKNPQMVRDFLQTELKSKSPAKFNQLVETLNEDLEDSDRSKEEIKRRAMEDSSLTVKERQHVEKNLTVKDNKLISDYANEKTKEVSLDVGKNLAESVLKSSAKRSVLAKAGEVFMSEFLGYFEKTYELSGSIETLNEGISEGNRKKVQEAYDSISLTTDLGPIYHSMNDLAVNTKEILNESKKISYTNSYLAGLSQDDLLKLHDNTKQLMSKYSSIAEMGYSFKDLSNNLRKTFENLVKYGSLSGLAQIEYYTYYMSFERIAGASSRVAGYSHSLTARIALENKKIEEELTRRGL